MSTTIQPRSDVASRPLAVAYLRRSTDRQEQSLDDQRRAIEIYAKREGFEIVDWFVDDAISGTSTGARRHTWTSTLGQRSPLWDAFLFAG